MRARPRRFRGRPARRGGGDAADLGDFHRCRPQVGIFELGDKFENVATRLAAEAVPDFLVELDPARGPLVGVEGAGYRPLRAAAAGFNVVVLKNALE